jgi:hypothetical protein
VHNRFRILSAALAASSVLAVVACGRTSDATSPLTPAAPMSSQTATGGAAALLPHAISGGAIAEIRYDPNGLVASPNDAWAIVPGTLFVRFAPELGAASSGAGAGARFSMPYPQAENAAILAAHAPVLAVSYANGTTLRFPAPGSFDPVRHRVTVEVPAALLQRATGATLALAKDRGKVADQPTGPRYWDGKAWKESGTIQSGKKTLVLIHGIFSSVESSFPAYRFFTGCPQKIADAGGFDQVLGFDYDWFEPPDKEGALFADFLKEVVAKKPSSLTVEAHSYGTLVTLAALPKLGPDAKIANAVTLGGPLPLRGTPLANPGNHWRMGMILGLLAWHFDTPPSFVDHAFDSGMVASLATNSDALKNILTNFKAMSNRPPVVQAAGTKWICLVGTVSHCAYSEETFKKVLIEGSGVELPWDGVVETLAAGSTDIPDAVATPFPLSHIDLQCAGDVIKWVAKQLK